MPNSAASRLAGRDHGVEIAALAGQHVREDLRGCVVWRTAARHAVGRKREDVRQVAIEGEAFRFHRLQLDFRPCRDGMVGNIAVKLLDFGQGCGCVHIADNDQNGITGRVPPGVELLEHLAGGLVERVFGAERVVGVGGAGEHVFVEPAHEFIGRVGEIARDFLLDCAAFLVPFGVGIVDSAQAGGLRLERHVEVGCGNRGEVLGDVLLGVRVVLAAELGVDGRGLVGGHAGAAAEGHVFLGVGHAGEAVRGLIAADEEIHLHIDDWRQRVANDDHSQSVGQRGAATAVSSGESRRKSEGKLRRPARGMRGF